MGAGGSVSMPSEMPSDADIQKAAESLPPEALEMMKKIVAAAEKKEAAKPAKAGTKTRDVIKKIGNSDEVDDMKRAVFMWDEEICKQAMKEIMEDKPLPEVMNGAMLVMEEVVFPDAESGKNWPKFLRKVAGMWFESQAEADKPFVPPDAAKEHCVYLMDAAAADAWLEKLGVKKVGKTGKQLMNNDERNAALDMDSADKVYESFPDEAVLFMKDIVKAASA